MHPNTQKLATLAKLAKLARLALAALCALAVLLSAAACGGSGGAGAATAAPPAAAATPAAAGAEAATTAAADGATTADAETSAAETTAAATAAATTAAEETAAAATEAAAPETADAPVHIMFWTGGNGDQKDHDMVWAEINKSIQKNVPNVIVENECIPWDEYAQRWATAMAAQETIDLAWTGWMIDKAEEIKKGSLLPLDDLVDKYGQGIRAALGDVFINANRRFGKIYQLQSWQGGAEVGVGTIWMPEELALLPGPDYPDELQQIAQEEYFGEDSEESANRILDKVEDYLAAAKAAGKIALGINTSNIYWRTFPCGIYRPVGMGVVKSGDDTFTVIKPNGGYIRACYKRYAEWFDKGYIRPDIASAEDGGIGSPGQNTGNWETDNIGIISVHNWCMRETKLIEKTEEDFHFRLALMQPDIVNLYDGSATGCSIPFTCKDPAKAMQVLNEFYVNIEAYHLYAYGIKDFHWIDNGDGTLTQTGGEGDPDSSWGYGQPQWVVGTCLNSIPKYKSDIGYYQSLKDAEANAWASPLLQFNLDDTEWETQSAQKKALDEEYLPMLTRGYLGSAGWEAKYDEYLAKVEATGIYDYIPKVQEQLSAYAAESNCKWNWPQPGAVIKK